MNAPAKVGRQPRKQAGREQKVWAAQTDLGLRRHLRRAHTQGEPRMVRLPDALDTRARYGMNAKIFHGRILRIPLALSAMGQSRGFRDVGRRPGLSPIAAERSAFERPDRDGALLMADTSSPRQRRVLVEHAQDLVAT